MTMSDDTRNVRTASLGWMIQRLAGRLDRDMETQLAPHGLNLQQFAVMMTVLETDGLSQAEIGGRFGSPAYAVSRAIDHLEAAGLLERRADPASRRRLTIHATAKGRKISATLFGIVKDVNNTLAAPLSASERASFAALLAKVLA